jgi:hypothetical protein
LVETKEKDFHSHIYLTQLDKLAVEEHMFNREHNIKLAGYQNRFQITMDCITREMTEIELHPNPMNRG